jgi:ribose transport system substrate-binding protein
MSKVVPLAYRMTYTTDSIIGEKRMRSTMLRRFGGVLAFAAIAAAVGGCPKEQPSDTAGGGPAGGGGGAAGKQLTIAVMPKGTKHQFWQAVKAGADQACKEENCTVDWAGPANEGSINDQVNLVETKITGKVDGIVLAATDATALNKPLLDAKAKGIPVVTIDSGVTDKDASLAYIATDNVEGGRRAAEALAKAMGEKGKVGLLIFQKGSASSDDRQKGFEEGIKKYPGIQLVSTLEANDPQKATETTLNMLTAHPEITGIFAANEPNGVGSANALKQKGLAGKVKLVAYDSSTEEIKALQDGIIQATIVQDPFQMGYKGVKTVLNAIRKKPISEKFINSGMTVVTKDNLNTPDVQKLVNPSK